MAPALTCASHRQQDSSLPLQLVSEDEFTFEGKTNKTTLSRTSPFSRGLLSQQALSTAVEFLPSKCGEGLTESDNACHVSNASDTTSSIDAVSATSLPASSPPPFSSASSSSAFSGPSSSSSSSLTFSRFFSALSSNASVICPSASLPLSPQKVHIPLENTVGYRNLEMFLSALLQTCSILASQQEKAAALVLFAALRRVVDQRLLDLKRWACRRWHVVTACDTQRGLHRRRDSGFPLLKRTKADFTNTATAECGSCTSALRASADHSPPASQEGSADKFPAKEGRRRIKNGVKSHACGSAVTPKVTSCSTLGVDTRQNATSSIPDGGFAPPVAGPPLPTGKDHATRKKERRDRQMRKEERKPATKERKNKGASCYSQGAAALEQQKVAGRLAKKEEIAKKGEATDKPMDVVPRVATSELFCPPSPSSASASSSFFPSSSELSSSLSNRSILRAHLCSEKQFDKGETTSAVMPVAKYADSEAHLSPFSSLSVAQQSICAASNSASPSALHGEREHTAKRTEKRKNTRQKSVPVSSGKVAEHVQKQQLLQRTQEDAEEQQQQKQQQGHKQNVHHLQASEQHQEKRKTHTYLCTFEADPAKGEYVYPLDAKKSSSCEGSKFLQAISTHNSTSPHTGETFSAFSSVGNTAGIRNFETELKNHAEQEGCQPRRSNGAQPSVDLQVDLASVADCGYIEA